MANESPKSRCTNPPSPALPSLSWIIIRIISAWEIAQASLSSPTPAQKGPVPRTSLSRFTWGQLSQRRGVRMPAPSLAAPLPPTTGRTPRTRVPGRGDSPRSPGAAMVRAHRTRNPDWPAAARASARAYSAAGLIPWRSAAPGRARPPPAARSSPSPSRRPAPPAAPSGFERGLPAAPRAHRRGQPHVGKERARCLLESRPRWG